MKLGIVGAGMIVEDFLSFISEIKGIELKAICGTINSQNKLIKLSEKHLIEKVYIDYNQMLDDEEIEVIYVAVPNHLHYSFCREALIHKKHVICEKPFTSSDEELKDLVNISKENNLMLFEAITNQYLPNYLEIKNQVNELGNIKIVECNYSQYSSRYDAFKEGNILPAFNRHMSGGALMDLNIYNVHFVVGLFGKPNHVQYLANIEKEIDVSGMLLLDYGYFKCVCIGAKDCKAPVSINIQGDEGCIHLDSPANQCVSFKKMLNKQEEEIYDLNQGKHRMFNEFTSFLKILNEKDYEEMNKRLEHSMNVMEIITKARKGAGIVFDCDEKTI